MKPTSWKQVILYLAILLVAYLAMNWLNGGFSSPSSMLPACTEQGNRNTSGSDQATTAVIPPPSTGSQVGPGEISINELPPEALTTLKLIKQGGPYPYAKDDTVFSNYEGLLPKKPTGYYHEYTVITPGSSDRGARRIVAGQNGEYYYTSDHYRSFKLIRE